MTRKAVKWSVIADQLAYNALEDYMPLNFDLLDEDIFSDGDGEMNDWWIMYFDGAMNVSRNGAGAVIISLEKK
jgi:hypothetical protein